MLKLSDILLQNYLVYVFQRAGSVFAFIVGTLIVFSGCESPGPVGNSLTDSETAVVVDTLEIGSISSEILNPYSGQRPFVSLGQFNDPLFGAHSVSAYLKPSLPPASSDTMEENTGMKLRLLLDGSQVYGDSAQSGTFDIYEINQQWRGRAWRLKNQISIDNSYTVGSFTLDTQDSLDVTLNEEWVNKYRSYFESGAGDRDSTYRADFHGLAILPRDDSKIVPLRAQSTRFVIENPEADTFDVSTGQWAFNLEREEDVSFPEGTTPLFNTLERIMSFSLDINEQNFPVTNISKAEIVFYLDQISMQQSLNSESGTTVRPRMNNLQLHLVDPAEIPDNIDPGSPVATAAYDDANKAYRFSVTSFIRAVVQNQTNPNEELYLTGEKNGTVKSILLHTNSETEPSKNPQLIITSVKNTSSTN